MTLADLPVSGMSYSIRQGDSEITVSIETIPLSEDDDEPRGRMN